MNPAYHLPPSVNPTSAVARPSMPAWRALLSGRMCRQCVAPALRADVSGIALFACLTLLATAQNTPTSDTPHFDAFRLIIDRNIFDPNRSGPPAPQTPRSTSRSPQIDSFTLVGTLGDNNNWVAFFNGSRSEFRGRLKIQDLIGDYTVSAISSSGVQLVSGTNSIHLRVGMQMRRENNGPWLASERGATRPDRDPSPRPETPAATSAANTAAGDSEVLRRLMQQREKELQ
jgi:hypothetical protein